MKNVIVKTFVFAFWGIFLLGSCGKEGDDDTLVQTQEEEQVKENRIISRNGGDSDCEVYKLNKGLKWVNIPEIPPKTSGIIVIDSNEKMKEYVDGEYTPIDFDNKTLLLTFGHELCLRTPCSYVLYKVGDKTFKLEITMLTRIAGEITKWRLALLVDKTEDASYSVELKR